jgi:segregation and condensation protein A
VSPARAAAAQTVPTTLENVDVINHLLFHKALVDHGEDTTRFNEYLHLLREGEHISIKDPFDRSIALAFDLVVQAKLNPWDIDLVKFSTRYLENAREREIDLVTAGRIILLAWTVLKLQSDDLVRKTEQRKEEAQNLQWEDIPDWGLSGPELDFTERVRLSPRAPIDEKVWHEGDRKVTLMELVDAFEAARQEAAQRAQFSAEREAFRARLKAEGRERFRNRVHREDLEEDLRVTWDRIAGRNGDAIPLRELYRDADVWDFVTTFNSVLFLRRDLKIELWQDDFPYGPIYVKNREAVAEAGTPEPGGQTQ